MEDFAEIEKFAKDYATNLNALRTLLDNLNTEVEAITKRKMSGIRIAVIKVKEAKEILREAIDSVRSLFAKPKTRIMHGVKIGLAKGRGKIKWDDKDQVIKLIRKHFPEQAEILIKTEEEPVRDALNNLSTADLRKLGIIVSDSDDKVVIKSVDSNVDKMVAALLKDDSEDILEAA
jgi:anion-transporting  ArsA/GET3 family ATPase